MPNPTPHPKRDAKILEYHQEKNYSLGQIAKIFHLSRERIRVIIKRKLSTIDKG